jgi:preprotein translocase subunit Sec61beta
MAEDKRVRLPASAGGIMQYYDEYKSKTSISPWVVIAMTIAVMIVVVLMHVLG